MFENSAFILFLLATGIRLGATLQWLILCYWLLRARRVDPRSWLLLAFTVAVISFLLVHVIVPVFPSQRILWWPLLFGAFGVPPLFWIATSALFQDRFRLKWQHLMAVIAAEIFGFTTAQGLPTTLLSPAAIGNAVILFPQIMNPIFVFLALLQLQQSKKDDLNESRLHFRKAFSWGTGLSTLIVTIFETIGKILPDYLYPLDAALAILIFFLGYLLAYHAQTHQFIFPEWWRNSAQPEAAPAPFEQTESAAVNQPQTLDAHAQALLSNLMEKESVYRRADLDLGGLAKLLSVPEYRLRRHINRELGFQNFNQFLNHYRIIEAQQVLSSKGGHDLPIYNLAIDLGFGSISSFNRIFKDATGMSPSQFRTSQHQKAQCSASSSDADERLARQTKTQKQ